MYITDMGNTMQYTVREAAQLTGLTAGRLRQMIRAYYHRSPSGRAKPLAGECRAEKVPSRWLAIGYAWVIPRSEVERIASTTSKVGRPRGGAA